MTDQEHICPTTRKKHNFGKEDCPHCNKPAADQEQKLLLCPFHPPKEEYEISMSFSQNNQGLKHHMVECSTCGAMGPYCETEEEAAKLWNARAQPTPAPDAPTRHQLMEACHIYQQRLGITLDDVLARKWPTAPDVQAEAERLSTIIIRGCSTPGDENGNWKDTADLIAASLQAMLDRGRGEK